MIEQNIRVVIAEPGKAARFAVIPNTIEAKKEIVGGFSSITCRKTTSILSATMWA